MTKPLLSIKNLNCAFETPQGVLHAVHNVSLDVAAGETVALVGESGCGKTTLAKSIVGLVRPTSGAIYLDGVDLTTLSSRDRRHTRQDVQFVFQDPFSSLNPRKTAEVLIREPLDVHRVGSRAERKERVHWLMQRVGLRAEWASRFPHEFSGGQRQRIGIARALALNPKLIVCDEPVSALDVSVQAQVINLLSDLQHEFGIAYLMITHDLALVENFAHRIAVMYLGEVVEIGESRAVWRKPLHPFTRSLIDAVPIPDPILARQARTLIQGDPPSPVMRPAGCAFAARCAQVAEICSGHHPDLRMVADDRLAACHFA